ncbi:hypothetical protein J7438_23330 [Thalassotalea sp. G20_0]|uniref:hypothetical protein n=1 Tax=Thalassotalea sp. G20_0 TaxID=2821093 RepID=UPI001ADA16DA|nr:hypothetical protein [Thalassotalea sp. G20_0]MBO9496998.1 hypothetical protein [Thalassotalea sp. G20_0]
MDRGGAGVSWQCTTSGNDYKKPDDRTDSAKSGRYRHGTVRQLDASLAYIRESNGFYAASDVCSADHPPRHLIKPVHGFKALITPEKMDYMIKISTHYGGHYDGKKHCQFALSIKQYTSASKRSLNHREQRQLIPLLHDFKATPGWTWRSLATTFHSFTSAGVFTPHKYMDEWVKEAQAALLSTLLDPVILKCNQKSEVFCARFYLDSGSNNKHSLEKHIGELFSRLANTSPGSIEDQSIIAMAASWLGRACPVIPYYTTNTSQSQSTFRDQLQSSIPSLKIEEEKSLNSLPPVDLLLPDYHIVIDIQGPSH